MQANGSSRKKWGRKVDFSEIFPPLLFFLFSSQKHTITRPDTSTLQDQSIQEPSIYNIVEEYKPNGHRWALNHLLEGTQPVSAAPLQSRSLIEYFNDFDDIFLFRFAQKHISAAQKQLGIAPDNTLTSTPRSFTTGGASADVSRLEGLRYSTSPYLYPHRNHYSIIYSYFCCQTICAEHVRTLLR